jgi:hypothetical protein
MNRKILQKDYSSIYLLRTPALSTYGVPTVIQVEHLSSTIRYCQTNPVDGNSALSKVSNMLLQGNGH